MATILSLGSMCMVIHYTITIYVFENFYNKMLEKIPFYDKNDEEIKSYKMLLKTGISTEHCIIA